MPLPHDLRMRVATEADLPPIAGLRESVGWAAHEWALRAVLEPPDARCLVAVDGHGEIVAVGSGISYGPIGVVGNMVVAEARRRQGVGAAMLEAILAFLDGERGCARLELYATPSGRPLYGRYGFAPTDPSAMVRLPRSIRLEPDASLAIEETTDAGAPAAYDAPRFGGDRRRLLERMAGDPDRPLLVARRDGAVGGYLWLRADGARVGPFVADTPQIAAALLADTFARMPAAAEVTLNLPTANLPGCRWLRGLGLPMDPWDGRMARGAAIDRREETIYGNVVGALG